MKGKGKKKRMRGKVRGGWVEEGREGGLMNREVETSEREREKEKKEREEEGREGGLMNREVETSEREREREKDESVVSKSTNRGAGFKI